jgi:hypothetical protein
VISFRTAFGSWFAWASIDAPDCTRMLYLASMVDSVATLTSLMLEIAEEMFCCWTVRDEAPVRLRRDSAAPIVRPAAAHLVDGVRDRSPMAPAEAAFSV